VCEELAQGRYIRRSGRDSNLRPIGCKSGAQITTPPCDMRGFFIIRRQNLNSDIKRY